jgi:membrane protease YdiL (CAAX protease family)
VDEKPSEPQLVVHEDVGEGKDAPPEPERAEGRPYPGIWQAIGLLALFVLLQIAVSFLLAPFQGVMDLAAMVGVGNVVACLLVLQWGFQRARRPFREVFPLSAFPALALVPLILVVAGLGIILSEIDNLTRWALPMPDLVERAFRELAEGGLPALITLVVVAPLTEEPLCRGLILGGFLRRYSATQAVLASAVLFALVHLNPYQLASAFVLGILLGWLFLKTASLLPCLFVHALHNAGGWIAADVLRLDVPGFTGSPDGPVEFQPLWFDLLGLLLVGIGLLALSRALGTTNHEKGHEESQPAQSDDLSGHVSG